MRCSSAELSTTSLRKTRRSNSSSRTSLPGRKKAAGAVYPATELNRSGARGPSSSAEKPTEPRPSPGQGPMRVPLRNLGMSRKRRSAVGASLHTRPPRGVHGTGLLGGL